MIIRNKNNNIKLVIIGTGKAEADLKNKVKELGLEGGAGNLVICEVMLMHISEDILDENKMIDQRKLHHVARLGGDWYCRVDETNLFKVQKPNIHLGIGIDSLPEGDQARFLEVID